MPRSHPAGTRPTGQCPPAPPSAQKGWTPGRRGPPRGGTFLRAGSRRGGGPGRPSREASSFQRPACRHGQLPTPPACSIWFPWVHPPASASRAEGAQPACTTRRFSSTMVAIVVRAPHSFWEGRRRGEKEKTGSGITAQLVACGSCAARGPSPWPASGPMPGQGLVPRLECTEQQVGCSRRVAAGRMAGDGCGHVANRILRLACVEVQARMPCNQESTMQCPDACLAMARTGGRHGDRRRQHERAQRHRLGLRRRGGVARPAADGVCGLGAACTAWGDQRALMQPSKGHEAGWRVRGVSLRPGPQATTAIRRASRAL